MPSGPEQGCSVPNFAVPHFSVKTAMLNDLDRTLTRSNLCVDAVLGAAVQFGLPVSSAENIKSTQRKLEAARQSFEPVSALQPELGYEFGDYVDSLLLTSKDVLMDVTYSDTHRYLDRQKKAGTPNICVTYGLDPLWQI